MEIPFCEGISFVSHVRSGDSSPRRRLPDKEGIANPCRTIRPIVTLMKVLDFLEVLVRAPDVSGPSRSRLRRPSFALHLPTVLLPSARAGRAAAVHSGHPPVNLTVDESRIRVPMHEGVDLQLRLVEGVRRRLHHVAIHDFPHSRVQTYLQTQMTEKIG